MSIFHLSHYSVNGGRWWHRNQMPSARSYEIYLHSPSNQDVTQSLFLTWFAHTYEYGSRAKIALSPWPLSRWCRYNTDPHFSLCNAVDSPMVEIHGSGRLLTSKIKRTKYLAKFEYNYVLRIYRVYEKLRYAFYIPGYLYRNSTHYSEFGLNRNIYRY